jgi:superfamily II DNA helicase RecQ
MFSWISDNYPDKSGIIYCFSRKESEDLAKELNTKGFFFW